MFKTILALLAIANAASAQLPVAKDIVRKDAGTNELTAQFVKTGLFLISGGGCNTLPRLSGNGLILVDGKLPGNYPVLLRQAGKLSFSDQPVRALINTNHQENHTGSNAKFLAAGTQIVGQENVSRNMTAAGSSMPPPTIVYDREYMKALTSWEWPGNVRELGNFVERAVILTRGRSLAAPLAELRKVTVDESRGAAKNASTDNDHIARIVKETIDALQGISRTAGDRERKQRDPIVRTLVETKGRVGGADGAAARMGMNRTTLLARMKKLGIDPRDCS